MTDRDLTNMMRDIDPRFQQKANARAAAYAQQHPRRSRMPGLLLGGAAACCALAAVLILLPKNAGYLHSVMQESMPGTASSAAESASDESTQHSPLEKENFDIVLAVSPAYGPNALKLSSAQIPALAAALTESEWTEIDTDAPYPDGETNKIYVHNHGKAFSLTQYADQTVELYWNDTAASSRWKISPEADAEIRAVTNPADPDSLDKQLVWCDPQTLDEVDIWENILWNKREGCDLTSKDDIYYMICNSAEYFEQASGVVRCGTDGLIYPLSCVMKKCVFQTNLNSGRAYSEEDSYLAPNLEMLLNMTDDSDYLREASSAESGNSEMSFSLDPNYVWHMPYKSAHFSDGTYQHDLHHDTVYPGDPDQAQHRRDYKPLTKEEQSISAIDGEVNLQNRQPLSNCGYLAANVLEGYRSAYIELYDFDSWDIIGRETLAGRECVSLMGHMNTEHCESVSGGVPNNVNDSFYFFVDTQTGVIMKYLDFHGDGTLAEFIVVDEIAFDEEAAPVQMLDLTGTKDISERYIKPAQ